MMRHLFLTGASGVGEATVIEPLRVPEQGRVFAHERFVSHQRVGRYGIDVESLRYGVEIALGDRSPLVVVDEVGRIAC